MLRLRILQCGAIVTFFGREPHHSHQQPVQGFVRGRDEGQPIDLPNWSMLVKVNAGDTLGRLTVLEGRMAPQLVGPPAHVHSGHDETFVVIEAGLPKFVGIFGPFSG